MKTIKDVAKESGLSVGTVSRYLNGEKLKSRNREAIEKAVEKLDYKTNAVARSMKTGQTMTIAVIVPHLANIFSMRVIESIEKELQKSNYCVIIADCGGDAEQEIQRIQFLKSRQVDGFVLMSSGHEANRIQQAIESVPLVLIDRILDKPIFDSVIINNEKITYEQVKKLLASGIRKIGMIEGPASISTAIQRKKGFENALREYDIRKEYGIQCHEYSYKEGYRAMKQLEKEQLEAVFASNYELSVGAVNANNDPTLKLLGFDAFEIPVRYAENYIGIPQPIEKIGCLAAQVLLRRILNPYKTIENIMISD